MASALRPSFCSTWAQAPVRMGVVGRVGLGLLGQVLVEAAFAAGQFIGPRPAFWPGLKKLDEYSEPHRPSKILYSSLYADVKPSFIVDLSAQFERRMTALLSYVSQFGETAEGGALFPNEEEIRDRLSAIARFYGNLIGVKYGEPFVVKEAVAIDDVVAMPVKSI